MPLTHPTLGDAHRYAVIVQSGGTAIHLGPYMKDTTAKAVYDAAGELAAHTDSVIVELVPSYYLPGSAAAQAKAAVSAVFPGLDDAMAANAAAAAKANAEASEAVAKVVTPAKTTETKTEKSEKVEAPEGPTMSEVEAKPPVKKPEIEGVKADKAPPKKAAAKKTAA
jgi:hypothetical protein